MEALLVKARSRDEPPIKYKWWHITANFLEVVLVSAAPAIFGTHSD